MLRKLIEKAELAVVKVICPDDSHGSGFLISADGHIITNDHVIEREILKNGVPFRDYFDDIVVKINNTDYKATIINHVDVEKSFAYDYSILKVEGLTNNPYLEMGDLNIVRQGDGVVCLGYPLEFDVIIATSGILSAVYCRPSHRDTCYQMRTFLSDTLIQSGNSGGPMLHVETGKVIGINTMLHGISDKKRLKEWLKQSETDDSPWLRELTDFCVNYIHSGLNHAVSIEYVLDDPAYPKI